MTQKQLQVFELLLVLSIGFLPSIIYSIYLVITNKLIEFNPDELVPYYIDHIIQASLSIVLMFYVINKQGKKISDIGLSLKIEWRDIGHAVGLMLIGLMTIGLIGIFITQFYPDFNSISNNEME